MENYIFWSEIGSGFEEPGGTPTPRIPRSTPTPAASTLPYTEETTIVQLRGEFCFPDRLVILNEKEYFDKSFRDINDQMPF